MTPPNISVPRFRVPTLACDCHMHVFGASDRYSFDSPRSYTPPEAPIDRYLARFRLLGLGRVVFVQPSVYGFDNRCMIEAMTRLGDTCRGVAVVPPSAPVGDLDALHRAGVRGVRVNLATHGITDCAEARKSILQLSERIAPYGWHLQLFLKPELFIDLAELIGVLPVPVVIDHMGLPDATGGIGQPGFAALQELMRAGHTWIKLSGADRVARSNDVFTAATPFARALIATRSDRIVWGSDWPHTGWHSQKNAMPDQVLPFRELDDGRLLDLIAEWGSDEVTQRRILVDNPTELYGF